MNSPRPTRLPSRVAPLSRKKLVASSKLPVKRNRTARTVCGASKLTGTISSADGAWGLMPVSDCRVFHSLSGASRGGSESGPVKTWMSALPY